MKRVVALVVAAALVTGAIVVNRWLSRDDGPSVPGRTVGTASGPFQIVCATEFERPCRRLATQDAMQGVATFSVLDPGATVDGLLQDPTPAFDLWLTSKPWDEIAAFRAERRGRAAPRLGAATEVLANTPLSAVARTGFGVIDPTRPAPPPAGGRTAFERDVLPVFCAPFGSGSPISGACLAAATGRPIQELVTDDGTSPFRLDSSIRSKRFTVGVAPASTTEGVLAIAAFTTGWFGGSLDQGAIDASDEFRSGFTALADTALVSRRPVTVLIEGGPASLALGLAVKRDLVDAAATDRFAEIKFTGTPTVDPDPPSMVSAEAVLVPAATDTGRAALRAIDRQAIAEAVVFGGWNRGPSPLPGIPLDAALLDRLAAQWSA